MEDETRIRTLYPIVDAETPVSDAWNLVDGLKAQGIVLADSFGFFRLDDLEPMRHMSGSIGSLITPRAFLERSDSAEVFIGPESDDPIIVGEDVIGGIAMVWTCDPSILRLAGSRWVCAFGHSVSPYPNDGKCPHDGQPLARKP